jgi:hypothetical protein
MVISRGIDEGCALGTPFYDLDAAQPGGTGVFFVRTPVSSAYSAYMGSIDAVESQELAATENYYVMQ